MYEYKVLDWIAHTYKLSDNSLFLKELSANPNALQNRNVMGIVQDAMLSCSRMTNGGIFVGKDVVMNIMMWIATWNGVISAPAILKPSPLWTSKQLFSMICPKINYREKSKIM